MTSTTAPKYGASGRYECPACGGRLFLFDASETGADYVCFGGHGYSQAVAWGASPERWYVLPAAVVAELMAEIRGEPMLPLMARAS